MERGLGSIMQQKIFIGSDHAGFRLKEEIKRLLDKLGYKYMDLGVYTDNNNSDYPRTALKVAQRVAKSNGKGVLICGTGIGEAIVANKVQGVRAANCFSEYTARMSREHNGSNLLCLGARVLNKGLAKRILKVWLETGFSNEARHKRRLAQIERIEKKLCK